MHYTPNLAIRIMRQMIFEDIRIASLDPFGYHFNHSLQNIEYLLIYSNIFQLLFAWYYQIGLIPFVQLLLISFHYALSLHVDKSLPYQIIPFPLPLSFPLSPFLNCYYHNIPHLFCQVPLESMLPKKTKNNSFNIMNLCSLR